MITLDQWITLQNEKQKVGGSTLSCIVFLLEIYLLHRWFVWLYAKSWFEKCQNAFETPYSGVFSFPDTSNWFY